MSSSSSSPSSHSSAWEASLPTTDSQLQRLAILDAHIKDLFLIDKEEDEDKQSTVTNDYSPSFPQGKSEQPTTMWAGANRGRIEEFLRSLESESEGGIEGRKEGMTEAAGTYVSTLAAYEEGLTVVTEKVEASLASLNDIEALYHAVAQRAESLHGTCQRLISEQHSLEQRKSLLAGPMEFFDELERLGPLLGIGGTAAVGGGGGGGAGGGGGKGGKPMSLPGRGVVVSGGGGSGGLLFTSRASPGSGEFAEVLARVDQAIAFFESHPQYKDSGAYLTKMRALQLRGLGLVKTQVLHLLESGTAKTAAARKKKSKHAQEHLETSPLYTQFRSFSERVRELVHLIDARAGGREGRQGGHEEEGEHSARLEELLDDCRKSYTHKRWTLLKPFLKTHFEAAVAACSPSRKRGEGGGGRGGGRGGGDAPALARTGAVVLARICQLESQLYNDFFGPPSPARPEEEEEDEDATPLHTTSSSSSSSSVPRPYRSSSQEYYESGALSQLLRGLCLLLHDVLRPLVIQEGDLDRLCTLINAVREEILQGQTLLRGDANLVYLEDVLDRIAKDAQERLIYASERVLRVEVEGFRPTPSDLEYPEKLEEYWEAKLGGREGGKEGGKESKKEGEREEKKKGGALTTGDGSIGAVLPLYATWFPTLRMTLTLLSKIYRAVEIHVFQDMAQQALAACNESLLAGAKVLRERKGDLDADLFLVKHLLILREQLVPFDIEFAAIEKRLDFKSTRGALTRFFVDTRKMFRVGADNALYSLAVDSVPTVNEEEIDSKKRLEDSLKVACNTFIEHATTHLAEPLQTLLQKSHAFLPSSSSSSSPSSSTPDAASLLTLSTQSFLQPDRVQATFLSAHERLATSTPHLLHLMSLYLDYNSSTKAILFRPVRQRVLSLLQQLAELLKLLPVPSSSEERTEATYEGEREGSGLLETVEGMLLSMKQTLNKFTEANVDGPIDGRGSRSNSAANSPVRQGMQESSSGPARTTTATTTTGKLHQQPTDTVHLKQELKQYVERKRGTLRIDVHGLRNLKPPTPENLCRVYPRQSPLPPVNDFILVATLGDKRWESPPCFPPNQVAVMLKKSFEFSDVPYPPPGPGLEFSVQYRDVNGRTVVQWQTQPVSGEEWSLATPSHHTSMPLLTPHRYYIGDVLAKACFIFNKPDRLPYKKCWKRFGNTVSFPPSLLPSFLRDRIDAFLGWFLDGLLFLSQAFPTFSSALPTFVTPSFLQLSWEGKALFFVVGFAVCASVSIIFACLFSLALFFAPVTAFLFTTSLLASVGLGAPAVMLMGFLFTFPSVDEKVFQPSVEWAVTRLPLVGRILLDDAGERKRGADR